MLKNTFDFIRNKVSEYYNSFKVLYSQVLNIKQEEYKKNKVLNNYYLLNIITFSYIIYILIKSSYSFLTIKYKQYKKSKVNNKEIIYRYKNQNYRLVVNSPFYVTRIIEAQDLDSNKDILELIKEYAGPTENFHNSNITPKLIGFKNIRISYMSEDDKVIVKVFKEKDILKID